MRLVSNIGQWLAPDGNALRTDFATPKILPSDIIPAFLIRRAAGVSRLVCHSIQLKLFQMLLSLCFSHLIWLFCL
jgi:hypothetical protein